MKIYLGATYGRRVELAEYRLQLMWHSLIVTSRWVVTPEPTVPYGGLSTVMRAELAQEDWEDVRAADIMINFTEPGDTAASSGGRHVEFGAALAFEKRCMIVGPRENVFHCLPEVEHFETWKRCLAELVK